MSCFTCAAKFGLLRKEHGCNSCGKAFCSDCLKYKAVIRQKGCVKESVCQDCFKRLTIPEAAGQPPPYSEYDHGLGGSSRKGFACTDQRVPLHFSHKKDGGNDADDIIRVRLDKLKERGELASTSGVIAAKFTEITGHAPQCTQRSEVLTPKPKLTEAEEVQALLQRTEKEVQIDRAFKPEGETVAENLTSMEERLLSLKGIDPENIRTKTSNEYNSDEDYDSVSQLVKKALAEANLDEQMKASGFGDLVSDDYVSDSDGDFKLPSVPRTAIGTYSFSNSSRSAETDEELPWCCICNADAQLRCRDCDDDLYCRRCFKEGHDEFDLKYHKVSPYVAKSSTKR